MFIGRLKCSLGGVKSHICLLLIRSTVEAILRSGLMCWPILHIYIELSSNSAYVAGKKTFIRFTTQLRELSFASCDYGKADHVCLSGSKITGQY